LLVDFPQTQCHDKNDWTYEGAAFFFTLTGETLGYEAPLHILILEDHPDDAELMVINWSARALR
jgi:hypothetical protein